MICYQLRCDQNHTFEGWFRDGDAFEAQSHAGQISCPECGSVTVGKALMAPAISRGTSPAEGAAPTPTPDAVLSALRALRRVVETRCDDVGTRFAEEALHRHAKQEAGEGLPERGIYGTMTRRDRARLEDEGVEFGSLPWVTPADA